MITVRRLNPVAPLALAILLFWNGAGATGPNESTQVRFAWTSPGAPAVVVLALPEDVDAGQIESVSVPADFTLVGFAVDKNARSLDIYLRLGEGGDASFVAIDLGLTDGSERRFGFGWARVTTVDAQTGPLRFERSLAATAGGLYQAVALHNDGDRDLRITAIKYLAEQASESAHDLALLYAIGTDPVALLTRLEEEMTPSARREAARDDHRSGPVPVEGFEWLPPLEPDLVLAPRDVVVLAWTERALPADGGIASYVLQPVIAYRVAGDATGTAAGASSEAVDGAGPVGDDAQSVWRLGLPVVVRAP
ncbi:MAG: hypothetical protein WD273_00535 [Trueperaceae bacterium]